MIDKKEIKKKYSGMTPEIKNSFYKLYKKQVDCFLLLFGGSAICGSLGFGIYKLSKWLDIDIATCIFLIVLVAVFSVSIVNILYALSQYIFFAFNQRRIPLTDKELKAFGFKTPDEYANFLYVFLHGIQPRDEIFKRIVLSAALYFNMLSVEDMLLFRFTDENGNLFTRKEDYSYANIASLDCKLEFISKTSFNRIVSNVFCGTWLDPFAKKDPFLNETETKIAEDKNTLLIVMLFTGVFGAIFALAFGILIIPPLI